MRSGTALFKDAMFTLFVYCYLFIFIFLCFTNAYNKKINKKGTQNRKGKKNFLC